MPIPKIPVYAFRIFPGTVAFVHTREQAIKFGKDHGFDNENEAIAWPSGSARATTSYRTDRYPSVVAINMQLCQEDDLDENETRALLAHEAHHAVSHVLNKIGDEKHSEEVWAYMLQSVSHFLFSEYDKVKAKGQHKSK